MNLNILSLQCLMILLSLVTILKSLNSS